MQLRVRFFAAFREATSQERLELSSEAATTAALFAEMMQRFDGLGHEPAALVAVNDVMVDWDTLLNDGDEVLFFPPVAGG